LSSYAILVDDFSIVNFKFSQVFEQAIEAKQTAEQLALKAQRDLERIKIEADQKVASARAEAEALRLQKENVTPQLIKLRQIEASIKAIEKWDGHLPKINSGAVPFIDVKSLEKD
jgi:regulator of protease activity HflC (stomatin/prohibitin superfamily)